MLGDFVLPTSQVKVRFEVSDFGAPSVVEAGIDDFRVRVYECGEVVRGDANGDGVIDIADVMYLINYLFIGGAPPGPLAAGDTNCDGTVDIADVMYMINYLFLAGSPPGS